MYIYLCPISHSEILKPLKCSNSNKYVICYIKEVTFGLHLRLGAGEFLWIELYTSTARGMGSVLFWFWNEGNGTPLQYSCLENPMDGGA